jgi:outer membrane autotransporter protein
MRSILAARRRPIQASLGAATIFKRQWAALAGAIGVVVLSASSPSLIRPAFAAPPPSAGCTNWNAVGPFTLGFFEQRVSSVAGPFNIGDRVTITIDKSENDTVLRILSAASRLVDLPPGSGPASITLTIEAGETSNIPDWRISTSTSTVGDTVMTFSCTPVASGNSDSQNIRSLQIATTTLVAHTSGQVITGQIRSGINDGFSNDGTPTSIGTNGGFINFAAHEPRSDTEKRVSDAFNSMGAAAGIYKAPMQKVLPRAEREWSAWADIRGTGWKISDTNGVINEQRGTQLNVTAGLGRRITPDTLVGIVVGYENFQYDVAALAGRLKGDGESVGGYFAQRLGSSIRFDAAVVWSHLNYNATAGTASGSFNGSRWIVSTGFTGNQKLGAYVLEPSASLYVLWERENAWTDSLGTLQEARNFSAGRTAIGARASRPFTESDGWRISPYAGLYADWRFQTDTALPAGATPVVGIGKGWSARVTTGVSATAVRGTVLSFNGEYGGLGADYKVWTGNVRSTVPF